MKDDAEYGNALIGSVRRGIPRASEMETEVDHYNTIDKERLISGVRSAMGPSLVSGTTADEALEWPGILITTHMGPIISK